MPDGLADREILKKTPCTAGAHHATSDNGSAQYTATALFRRLG
jgi:hypothetical protein